MRTKAFCLLFSSICLLAPLPTLAASRDSVRWEPVLRMGDEFYPSFVLATATMPKKEQARQPKFILGDARGLMGISVISSFPKASVRLVVKIDQLRTTGRYEGVLREEGKTYRVFPTMQYRYDDLLKIRQLVPVNVTFDLYINNKLVGQKVKVLRAHSINDCPYWFRDDQGKEHSCRWMYASYVNEDHHLIDGILREALDTKVVRSFNGYRGKPKDVYRQVFAIWNALQRKGFNYSSISTAVTSGSSSRVRSQNVRFLDQTVKTRQANCVDGTVLFASILRKIKIDPVLVRIPGHVFLGFYLDKERKQREYLETTLIGKVDLSKYPEAKDSIGSEESKNDKGTKNRVSYRVFVQALRQGKETFEKNKEAFTKRQDPDYQVIDVSLARKFGVMPIARLTSGD